MTRDLLGSRGCLLDIAGDLQYRRTLLVHGRGDGGGDLFHPMAGLRDALDGGQGDAGFCLDRGDLGADVLSCLGGLIGQNARYARI